MNQSGWKNALHPSCPTQRSVSREDIGLSVLVTRNRLSNCKIPIKPGPRFSSTGDLRDVAIDGDCRRLVRVAFSVWAVHSG